MAATLFGVLSMSTATIEGQDKKEEPKKSPRYDLKETYDLKVSVRQKAGEIFINPLETVAVWVNPPKGARRLYVWTAATSIKPVKGSEITDAKTGDVWVVERSTKIETYYDCEVTKKPAEKKDEPKKP